MTHARMLQVEGRLQVIEMTGAWGAYAGERIMLGPAKSFRDDFGIKIREMFEEGAAEGAPRQSLSIGAIRVAKCPRHDRTH